MKKKTKKEELHEALLWHKERNGVRCDLCAVNCFISKEKIGSCLVRKNIDNRLFTTNTKVAALAVDNVERRPLYHFYPGSKSLSISGTGDVNWIISHDRLAKNDRDYTPEQIVKIAEKENIPAISYTYFEPTIFFEYVYRVAKLAHRSNIKNIFVTNGLITEEAVKKVSKYLDAAVVNVKGSGDDEVARKFSLMKDSDNVFRVLKQFKKQRLHLEITNTIIPQIGDDVEKARKLAEWIAHEISPTVPLHVLQFHPDDRFQDIPFTPISTLEQMADVSNRSGLRYVYIGNAIQPHEKENTYCYNCRQLLISRVSGNLKKNTMQKDRCGNCDMKIDIVV